MKTKFYQLKETKINYIKNVTKPSIIANCFFDFYKSSSNTYKEQFSVAEISNNYNLKSISLVALGTSSNCNLYPNEIFRQAIKNDTRFIILCHNHPSGNLEPSDEDLETTKELEKISKILRIKILDHIIINSKNEYYSFLENNLLKN